MIGRPWPLVAVAFLASCAALPPAHEFAAAVRSDLKPRIATTPGPRGIARAVAAARDDRGVQSDFVEGMIALHVRSDADLPAYLARFGGTVVRDNALPEVPAAFGVQLTPAQRKATTYYIRIDPAQVDPTTMTANARAAGLQGRVEFSSKLALLTFAAIVNARAAGFKAGGDFLYRPQQAFPRVIVNSNERGGLNAFDEPRYAGRTNVTLAWQFVAAHGIQRPVRVAIVDSGFWLDAAGFARGGDSDFPAPPGKPMQYDWFANRPIADGQNLTPCTAAIPCFWHGTGAASVAMGIMNNGKGLAGTGALVGDVLLIKTGDAEGDFKDSIKLAVALGADVVSLSWGGSCNVFCRMSDRDDATFDDRYNVGKRPIFVVSAGNDHDYVDDPHFVHPCIEDHVICVGALNDPPDDGTMAPYSNYGEAVDVFAPSNIPVMSFPPDFDAAGNPAPFGPEQPQVFSGTSASAPFVAGIAAMMKAINPNLNSDDVATILVATSHPGADPAVHIVDALAAVRAAAQGIPIVSDRFETNDTDLLATNLPTFSFYLEPNLNIDASDRDYFRFAVPGASVAAILLRYPQALGKLSVLDFFADSTRCAAPVAVSDTPLPSGLQRIVRYRVAGGTHVLGLGAASANAYDLTIDFESTAVAADAYEPDDTEETAKSLYSVVFTPHSGGRASFGYSPRVRIDATIHSGNDVDFYIVQGASVTAKEQLLLDAAPTLKVYSNDSPISMDVYRLTSARTAGALVASLSAPACAKDALAVTLETDVYYLVRVSGAPGAYVLSNDVAGSGRRLPQVVHDGMYGALHPGEPVEHSFPDVEETYVLPGDREYDAIRSNDARVHLKLLDIRGALVAEGTPDGRGERVDLRQASVEGFYVLQIGRRDRDAAPSELKLEWEPAPAMRTSANLLANARARAEDRGGLHEQVQLDETWRNAVAAGRVKARFTATLNATLTERGGARAKVTFLDRAGKSLGTMALPRIPPLVRDAATQRLPAEVDDDVPRRTAGLRVDVAPMRPGGGADRRSDDVFADDLALVLTEYAR